MRYNLSEIRPMTKERIEELIDESKVKIVRYASKNHTASEKYTKNLIKFEQVLREKHA